MVGGTQKERGLKAGLRSSRNYYRALDAESARTVTFSPYRDGAEPVEFSYDFSFNYHPRAYERPGPVVEIHRLRACPLTVSSPRMSATRTRPGAAGPTRVRHAQPWRRTG